MSERFHTMRHTHRCPSCGHGKVLHFRKIVEAGHNAVHDLTLQKHHSFWLGIHDDAAPLQAYVCKGCGLVEWYVANLQGVQVDGVNVVELSADEPPQGTSEPYR